MSFDGMDAEELAERIAALEDRNVSLVIELVGGAASWRLADRRFGDGASLRTLAREEGRSYSTIRRETDQVWAVAERHRMTPRGWRRHGPGRPARTVGRASGNSHDAHATGKRRGRTGQAIGQKNNV